ncbi:hypothetical protein LDENG_00100680 [Lucifuga dentata]|nr:hypothetical protein LDENG_00100680 [Lucifuga dentata]
MDFSTVCWLFDFLTNRSQTVRVNGVSSSKLVSSTGSLQGCVLSPLLFSLYTNDCQSYYEGRYVIKFADDSVIVLLLSDSVTATVQWLICLVSGVISPFYPPNIFLLSSCISHIIQLYNQYSFSILTESSKQVKYKTNNYLQEKNNNT